MENGVLEVNVDRVDGTISTSVSDLLAVEEPLEIQLRYGVRSKRTIKSIAVTMRTPGHDFELASGFLTTEGIIRDPFDIEEHSFAESDASMPDVPDRTILPSARALGPVNRILISLAPDVHIPKSQLERNFYMTSSCGICGKASILALQTLCPVRTTNRFFIALDVLRSLPQQLRDAQTLFSRTGSLHGAALFTAEGYLLSAREDIGRHNAVDKLLGFEFLNDRLPLKDALLMLSGRVSFELLQKALMGGVGMIAAIGGPSTLAVEVARRFDLPLVGFMRQDRLNIYHGSEHVLGWSQHT